MKSIFLLFINFAWLGLGFVLADELSDFSKNVFKGGRAYSENEIDVVADRNDWQDHHRIILQVQMLASVDDPGRYSRAIALCTEYIDSGSVRWARDYLMMQRGFLRNLNGERATGSSDLEAVVANNSFGVLDSTTDPVLDGMRFRQKNLSAYFGNVMRQSIGHYYLDFAKDKSSPEKAYRFFSSISSPGLRDECLKQLRLRVGDRYDEIAKSVGDEDNTDEIRQPRHSSRDETATEAKQRTARPSSGRQAEKPQSAGINGLPWVGLGLLSIAISVAAVLFWKRLN